MNATNKIILALALSSTLYTIGFSVKIPDYDVNLNMIVLDENMVAPIIGAKPKQSDRSVSVMCDSHDELGTVPLLTADTQTSGKQLAYSGDVSEKRQGAFVETYYPLHAFCKNTDSLFLEISNSVIDLKEPNLTSGAIGKKSLIINLPRIDFNNEGGYTLDLNHKEWKKDWVKKYESPSVKRLSEYINGRRNVIFAAIAKDIPELVVFIERTKANGHIETYYVMFDSDGFYARKELEQKNKKDEKKEEKIEKNFENKNQKPFDNSNDVKGTGNGANNFE